MVKKERIDVLLVERGLAVSRDRAKRLLLAGQVLVDDVPIDKAGTKVFRDAAIRLRSQDHPYVSRGGLKLAGALDDLGVEVEGLHCLDVGSSTGGFTDCLLQSRASRVYAVDVAYGILDWKLQQDDRVVNLERTHAADLTKEKVPEFIDLLVADISFNSLSRLLPPVIPLLRSAAQMIVLVKPQFELEPEFVGEGGIVHDEAARHLACERVCASVSELGWQVDGLIESSIKGTRGNIEFLLRAKKS